MDGRIAQNSAGLKLYNEDDLSEQEKTDNLVQTAPVIENISWVQDTETDNTGVTTFTAIGFSGWSVYTDLGDTRPQMRYRDQEYNGFGDVTDFVYTNNYDIFWAQDQTEAKVTIYFEGYYSKPDQPNSGYSTATPDYTHHITKTLIRKTYANDISCHPYLEYYETPKFITQVT